MITIYCECGEQYHADEEHAGKKIVCNRCQRILVIAEKKQVDVRIYYPNANQSKEGVSNSPYTSVNIQEDRISNDLFKKIGKYAIILLWYWSSR
ncbi:MAG: hypothetical protein WAV76_14930 [Bacteroidota bacterium]